MQVSNSSLRRQQRRINEPTKKFSGEYVADLLKLAFGIASFIGLILACFGFGVALALNSTFDVGSLEILHGPSDYIAASAYVVLEIFNALYAPERDQLPSILFITLIIFGIITVATFMLMRMLSDPRFKKSKFVLKVRATAIKLRGWAGLISQFRPLCRRLALGFLAVACLFPALNFSMLTVICTLLISLVLYAIADWRAFRFAGVSLGVGAAPTLVTFISIKALPYILVVFLIPFVISLKSAERYFYEWVIEPAACRPLRSAADRRQSWLRSQLSSTSDKSQTTEHTAKCVQIERKGGLINEGREVISTADVVVLFDPISGAVQVLPHKDAVVTTIGRLDVMTPVAVTQPLRISGSAPSH